jgi:hypothetical protein
LSFHYELVCKYFFLVLQVIALIGSLIEQLAPTLSFDAAAALQVPRVVAERDEEMTAMYL